MRKLEWLKLGGGRTQVVVSGQPTELTRGTPPRPYIDRVACYSAELIKPIHNAFVPLGHYFNWLSYNRG